MSSIDLPDINVWIALSAPDHAHRKRAESYWQSEAAPVVAFNSVTRLGFLRVCTNAPIFNGVPLTPENAWSAYLSWMRQSETTLLSESENCSAELGRFVIAGSVTRKMWTDAYLAALAIGSALRLVSFDADFARFDGLNFLHLNV